MTLERLDPDVLDERQLRVCTDCGIVVHVRHVQSLGECPHCD